MLEDLIKKVDEGQLILIDIKNNDGLYLLFQIKDTNYGIEYIIKDKICTILDEKIWLLM